MYLPLYTTGETAEQNMPLVFHGNFIKQNGWRNPITLVFMKGYRRLSNAYVSLLRACGYKIYDESAISKKLKKIYRNIAQLPDYLFYTFIRWIVLKEMIDREKISLPLILIDGDIIFTADPNAIKEEVAGKTFLLQGNPCFTVISNYFWFDQYEEELLQYNEDMAAYNNDAINNNNIVQPDRNYCNLSLFRFPLRHEQDFQEYLISRGYLIQEKTENIFSKSSYYWMQNPLYPAQWAEEQQIRGKFIFNQKDNSYWVGEKRVPFIHFQTNFSEYCWHWLFAYRHNFEYFSRFMFSIRNDKKASVRSGLDIKIIKEYEESLYRASLYSRLTVCREAFQTNLRTGSHFILDILNSLLNIE
jgi:hypothetical protein